MTHISEFENIVWRCQSSACTMDLGPYASEATGIYWQSNLLLRVPTIWGPWSHYFGANIDEEFLMLLQLILFSTFPVELVRKRKYTLEMPVSRFALS